MANVRISNFPVPFALPVAPTINGTETLPFDQTVGGVVTTVSGLFSRLLGPISVNYATGAVVVAGIADSIANVLTVGGNSIAGQLTVAITNTSTADQTDARITINSGAASARIFAYPPAQSTSPITGGITGAQGIFGVLGTGAAMVFSTANAYRGHITSTGQWIVQGAIDPGLLINSAAASSGLEIQSADSVSVQLQVIDGGASNIAVRLGTTNTIGTVGATGTNAVLALLTGGANRTFQDPNGILYWVSPTPTAVNATATLTIAQLLTLIITSTTALAVTATLPTGTLTDNGIFGPAGPVISAPVHTSFDWSVINTGALAFTLAAAAGHTIVGSAIVAAATSALFRTQKTAINTYVTYRLAV